MHDQFTSSANPEIQLFELELPGLSSNAQVFMKGEPSLNDIIVTNTTARGGFPDYESPDVTEMGVDDMWLEVRREMAGRSDFAFVYIPETASGISIDQTTIKAAIDKHTGAQMTIAPVSSGSNLWSRAARVLGLA